MCFYDCVYFLLLEVINIIISKLTHREYQNHPRAVDSLRVLSPKYLQTHCLALNFTSYRCPLLLKIHSDYQPQLPDSQE